MKRVFFILVISGFVGISGANTPCVKCDVDSIIPSMYDTLIPADTIEAIKDRAIHKAIVTQLRTVDSLRLLRDSLTIEYKHLLREMKKKKIVGGVDEWQTADGSTIRAKWYYYRYPDGTVSFDTLKYYKNDPSNRRKFKAFRP